MPAPIFTVRIPDDVGFTDQLMQLALLYRVGTAAGMAFRMTPLASSRSAPGFWKRFDLGAILPSASPAELALPRQVIDLSPERLLRAGVRDGAGLVELVRAQLPAPGTLAELRLQGESRTLLTRIVGADPVRFEGGLGRQLQALFAPPPAAARRRPSPELRLLAHVRCGDAADIALFPQTGYLAWHRVIARTGEVRQSPFLGLRILIEALRAHLGTRPLRCEVFSDGYARTLELIGEVEGQADGPTPAEAALLRVAVGVHQHAAEALMQGAGIRAVIGEDLDALCALLWEAQQADLIVITGNQRMLPKFLALLGPRECPPALLLLEADGDQARFMRTAGLTEAHAALITLSPHGDPLAPLFAYLRDGGLGGERARVAALAAEAGIGAYCIPELAQRAGDLEAWGRPEDAAALYDWLAVLTDLGPEALAGLARCRDPQAAAPATEDGEERSRAAAQRARGQVVAQLSALLSLGRLQRAREVMRAARERWGAWDALEQCQRRLETLDTITHGRWLLSPEQARPLGAEPDPPSPPEPQRGLVASILRLMGKRRPPQPMAPDAQSSKS